MAAKIIIQRNSEFLNKMRGVAVLIDDAERGLLRNGGSEEYIVEPGVHKVQCKVSWYKSAEMTVTLNEGDSKFLKVGMGMKYFGATYVILLLAILSDFLPRVAQFQRPEWWSWMKLAIIIPVIIYYLYYLTLGKKNYIILQEDKGNIFN